MVAQHNQLDSLLFRIGDDGARIYAERMLASLQDRNAGIFLAECEALAVGYISGSIANITTEMFQPLRCGFVANLYVCPGYRRRGLGEQLVERLCLWFRARGITHYEWHVSAYNAPALAFWRRRGGEPSIIRMRAHLGPQERQDRP